MRFRQKRKIDKTILVVSDLHLGAGVVVNNLRNYLEDFHYDREFVDFLEYYSTGEYLNREVELVINGDFLDFLAVPFVKYFDDQFWSEEASVEKLQLIIKGHREVFDALNEFLKRPLNKIVYIIGNHDAEMILPNVQAKFLQQFSEEARGNFSIITPEKGEYIPAPGVILQHGHEYEMANYYEPSSSVIVDDQGRRYLLPPWGSYFVTRVINKFKEERPYVNSVRPIKKFFINGLIYDTLFTIRLLIANIYYLLMVRFITYYKESRSYKKIRERLNDEFQVFRDSELLGSEFFADHPGSTILVMGHTHQPHFRTFIDGRVFINTGTWTKMYNLDLGKKTEDFYLTFAQIDIMDPAEKGSAVPRDHMDVALNVWRGHHNLPYYDYRS